MNDLPKTLTNKQMQNLIDSNLFSISFDPDIDGYAATPNYHRSRRKSGQLVQRR